MAEVVHIVMEWRQVISRCTLERLMNGRCGRNTSSYHISTRVSRDPDGRDLIHMSHQRIWLTRHTKDPKESRVKCSSHNDILITQLEKSCFQVVRNCRTSEYKKGSGRLAWEAWCTMKQPKTNHRIVMLKSQFIMCKMMRDRDPNQWKNL